MSKQVLGVKARGNAVTVYVNPTTDQPISIAAFEDEPIDGFPKIYSREEVRAAFPSREVVFIEEQKAPPPESDTSGVSEEEVDRIDREGKAQIAKLAAKHGVKIEVPAKQEKPAQATSSPAQLTAVASLSTPIQFLPANIEQELRTMLAKRQVATGKTKKELDQEINHVFNFIVRLEPAARDTLRTLAASYREAERESF